MTLSRLGCVQVQRVRDTYGETPGKPFKARIGILGVATFMRWVEEAELSEKPQKDGAMGDQVSCVTEATGRRKGLRAHWSMKT